MSHLPDDPADLFDDAPIQQLSDAHIGEGESKQNIFPSGLVDAQNKLSESMNPTDFLTEDIPPNAVLHITVSDPEKKGDGLQAFVTYKITTKIEVSPGKYRYSAVVRRYSDFDYLHTQLTNNYPGWLIPPLPEKAIVGRFSAGFVDSRRRGLELFLNRVARHVEMSKSDDLKLFLHGGQDFQDVRDGKIKPKQAKQKTFFELVNDISQTVQSTLGTAKDREKSHDDLECDKIAAYVESLETYVSTVNKNVSTLTQKTKEIANAWFDFGFACTLLGQYESEQEEAQLGNAFAKIGNCADRLSVLLSQMVDTQVVWFQEPFSDFLRIVSAVKDMLKVRTAALTTHHHSLANLESKQQNLAKIQAKAGKEDRITAAEADVVEAQRRVDHDAQQLQQITQHVYEEVARFRREKRSDFKANLLEFVKVQIEHAKKVQKAWEAILPEIESMPFGGENP